MSAFRCRSCRSLGCENNTQLHMLIFKNSKDLQLAGCGSSFFERQEREVYWTIVIILWNTGISWLLTYLSPSMPIFLHNSADFRWSFHRADIVTSGVNKRALKWGFRVPVCRGLIIGPGNYKIAILQQVIGFMPGIHQFNYADRRVRGTASGRAIQHHRSFFVF